MAERNFTDTSVAERDHIARTYRPPAAGAKRNANGLPRSASVNARSPDPGAVLFALPEIYLPPKSRRNDRKKRLGRVAAFSW